MVTPQAEMVFVSELTLQMKAHGLLIDSDSVSYGGVHAQAVSAKFTQGDGKPPLLLVVTTGAIGWYNNADNLYLNGDDLDAAIAKRNARVVATHVAVLAIHGQLPARLHEGAELPLWVTQGDVEALCQ